MVHDLGVDLALVWAAHDTRDIPSDSNVVVVSHVYDVLELFKAFVDRAVDVLFCECFRGSCKHGDLLAADTDRLLHAFEIRNKRRVGYSRLLDDSLEDLGIVAHLRHPLGRHEARRLDGAKAGVRQPVYEIDLDSGRHEGLLVLQTVSRTDLDDLDPFWQHYAARLDKPLLDERLPGIGE